MGGVAWLDGGGESPSSSFGGGHIRTLGAIFLPRLGEKEAENPSDNDICMHTEAGWTEGGREGPGCVCVCEGGGQCGWEESGRLGRSGASQQPDAEARFHVFLVRLHASRSIFIRLFFLNWVVPGIVL